MKSPRVEGEEALEPGAGYSGSTITNEIERSPMQHLKQLVQMYLTVDLDHTRTGKHLSFKLAHAIVHFIRELQP